MGSTPDAFLAIVQSEEAEPITMPEPPQPVQPDPKNPITLPPPKPYLAFAQKDLIPRGAYSNDSSKLRSVPQILQESAEEQFIL